MPDPLQFPSATARFQLPLLFAGQAQKEAFVNTALGLCDALIHPAVEGETADPPADPGEGEGWLVGAGAGGAFAGRDGLVACRQAGQWLFTAPRDGMRVFDRATGQHILYFGGWRREPAPAMPSGGTTVDIEARTAINQLIAALAAVGVLPAN